jgi:hypothetical protein
MVLEMSLHHGGEGIVDQRSSHCGARKQTEQVGEIYPQKTCVITQIAPPAETQYSTQEPMGWGIFHTQTTAI